MGETSASPEVSNRVVPDLTAMEVQPDQGERLYKASLIQSSSGVVYRMLSKSFQSGRLDLVHYGCDLDDDGNPKAKWRIRRILDQSPERFDREIETMKKAVADDGEQVVGTWIHDMTSMTDLAAQGSSLESWSKQMAAEVKRKPS